MTGSLFENCLYDLDRANGCYKKKNSSICQTVQITYCSLYKSLKCLSWIISPKLHKLATTTSAGQYQKLDIVICPQVYIDIYIVILNDKFM